VSPLLASSGALPKEMRSVLHVSRAIEGLRGKAGRCDLAVLDRSRLA
jgi:hypothetical protein